MEGAAYSERIIQKRADDELGNCSGDLLGEARNLALRTRAHIEVPASGYQLLSRGPGAAER